VYASCAHLHALNTPHTHTTVPVKLFVDGEGERRERRGGVVEGGEVWRREEEGMGKNKSYEPGLNLSGSWQQGHSAAYNTQFEQSRLQRIYPNDD
jgi:hypothetical protein